VLPARRNREVVLARMPSSALHAILGETRQRDPPGGVPRRLPVQRSALIAARAPVLLQIACVGLTIIGLFFAVASLNDLRATHASGLPADHAKAFANQAGTSYAAVTRAAPGVAGYITNLEYGYALHELVFAILLLAVVLIPFRHRDRWAWAACWVALIASVGYSLTFGAHDATVMRYSLVTDIAIPVLLLLAAPAFFAKDRPVSGRR
jgi:hypothetical protein